MTYITGGKDLLTLFFTLKVTYILTLILVKVQTNLKNISKHFFFKLMQLN